jgi:hypothetical protein
MNRSKISKRWFWAWVVLGTTQVKVTKNSGNKCEVWKNLIIVEAANADQAYSKALAFGKAESGDCGGTLRLDGHPAKTRYLGITDIGVIHEELKDGAEILWQLETTTLKSAKRLPRPRRELLRRLENELKPYAKESKPKKLRSSERKLVIRNQ